MKYFPKSQRKSNLWLFVLLIIITTFLINLQSTRAQDSEDIPDSEETVPNLFTPQSESGMMPSAPLEAHETEARFIEIQLRNADGEIS